MQKPSPPDRAVIDVVIGIVCRDGSFLISQRRADQHLGCFWEFPGGKRENAENELQTLHRELREELNLEIEGAQFFHRLEYEYPDRYLRLSFYLCKTAAGSEPRALQVERFKWVSRDQLKSYRFPPANEPILDKLASFPA